MSVAMHLQAVPVLGEYLVYGEPALQTNPNGIAEVRRGGCTLQFVYRTPHVSTIGASPNENRCNIPNHRIYPACW